MTKRFGFNAPPKVRLLCGGAIAVLVGFVALASYTIVDAWRATWANAVQSSENLAATLAHDVDRNITLYDLSLQTVVSGLKLPGISSLSPAMRDAVLFDGSTNAPEFGATFVIDEHGDPKVISRETPVAHDNFATRDFFVAQRDHRNLGLFISAPYQFKISKEWAIAFSRRIENSDGSFAGIVFGSVKLDYFRHLFDRVNLGHDGTISLLRGDGTVLMRKPLVLADIGRKVPDFEHFPIANAGHFATTGKFDGVERLFVYQRAGELPLVVAVAPTVQGIFAEWERKAGVAAALMLCLVIMAAWLLLRLVREFRRRAIAEQRAVASEQRHKLVAEAERQARAALEHSMAQVEQSVHEQHRAQLALRESERRFRNFAESCGDWFWETGPDHRFTPYLGNSQNPPEAMDRDAIGKTTWEIAAIDPDADPAWRAYKNALDERRPFRRFHYSIPTQNGQWTHISTSGIPIFDELGEFAGYRGTAFDITFSVEARRRAEQAEALLRNAVDSISEGFVIFDAEDRFVMCNAAYELLYSIVAPELQRGTPFEAILRAGLGRSSTRRTDTEREAWIARRVAEHRNPPAQPMERQLWDGRWALVCERRMSDGGIAGLQIDITALKKTQQALHESQQRLARAQRIAGVGDIELDVETHAVTWSDHAYEIYGVPKGHVPGLKEFLDLVHPDDRERVRAVVERIRSGQAAPNIEYRLIRPDGQLRHVLRENETILDEGGKVIRVASTVQDITELRQSQERERELQAQLEHRQKLEALGTLAGGIAHDMNNTLVPILALSKRAMTRAPEGSRERLNLETIYHASEHARDLVKQILAFSRKENVDKKPVGLGSITRDALQILRASLPAMIVLVEQIDDAPEVMGDAGQLRQVIVNLVTNAAQAIGDNTGTITVQIESSPEWAFLSVADTGCGIDERHLPRLFDPFFTTKEAGQGTGLGLSVVHGIVTAHGGRIEVDSVLGSGAVFTIVLPTLAAQNDAATVDSAA
jgi:PAS domain S-box-containing protein